MKPIIIFIIFSIQIVGYAQQDRWEIISKMPIPVTGCQAILLDSLIYIVGGYNDTLKIVDYVQEYNPHSNSWRIAGRLKTKRMNMIAKNYKGNILIIGGDAHDTTKSSYLEFWNKKDSTAMGNSNINFKRQFFVAEVHNSKLYIIGGIHNGMSMNKIPYLIEYDLDEGKVTYFNDKMYLNNFPIMLMSVLVGDDIYIFGGIKIGISKDVIRFNTLTHDYERINYDLNQGRAGGSAVYDSNNKDIYLIGGTNESLNALASVEMFSLLGGQKKFAPPLNVRRKNCSAIYYDNSIYVFGGSNQYDESVPEVEVYRTGPTSVNEDINLENIDFKLNNNFPNPFNSSTTISFNLYERGFVSLSVYDVLGYKITTLVNEERPVGTYRNTFDASGLASGFYIVRLTVNSNSTSQKIILMK